MLGNWAQEFTLILRLSKTLEDCHRFKVSLGYIVTSRTT